MATGLMLYKPAGPVTVLVPVRALQLGRQPVRCQPLLWCPVSRMLAFAGAVRADRRRQRGHKRGGRRIALGQAMSSLASCRFPDFRAGIRPGSAAKRELWKP